MLSNDHYMDRTLYLVRSRSCKSYSGGNRCFCKEGSKLKLKSSISTEEGILLGIYFLHMNSVDRL